MIKWFSLKRHKILVFECNFNEYEITKTLHDSTDLRDNQSP